MSAPGASSGVRTAEIVASLSLATDLAMGFPFENGLHSTLAAMRLGEKLDLDAETRQLVYYTSLLAYSWCTTDAAEAARLFGSDLIARQAPVAFATPRATTTGTIRAIPDPESRGLAWGFRAARGLPAALRFLKPHLRARCEVAEMLSRRLGMPELVSESLHNLTDRWDGKGALNRAGGDQIPLHLRIALVAADATYQRTVGGVQYAIDTIESRAGRAFDPNVAEAFVANGEEVLAVPSQASSIWDHVLGAEPGPTLELQGKEIDEALAAIGDFSDLISPSLSGHSGGLSKLAVSAAELAGFADEDIKLIQRAAWVHDVGRVAIPSRVWEKPGVLTVDELEQVRMHTYHSERVLTPSPFLGTLAPVAAAHHEHLDGSGYHQGLTAPVLSRAARLLAVADIYHAMIGPRPHRQPLPPPTAASLLAEQVREGHLDADMVEAVLEAAVLEQTPLDPPVGLSDREVEALGLLSRGLQTKLIANGLGISSRAAESHVASAYDKIGVTTRAAATFFVMQHGLVPRGALPIDD